MKLTKSKLKEIIYESLEEQEQEQAPAAAPAGQPDMRQKKVATATETGSLMSPEEWSDMLTKILLTKKISPMNRKKALEAMFGNIGLRINSTLLQMQKAAQQGAQE